MTQYQTTPTQLDDSLASIAGEGLGIEWDAVDGESAVEFLAALQKTINILALVKARCALRVEETNQHKALRLTPASFVASITDVSKGSARKSLELASQLRSLPDIEAVVETGGLNLTKAVAIADVATADPDASEELLEAGLQENTKNLLAFCDKVRARKASKKRREDAIKNRSLTWTRHDELSSKMTLIVPNESRAEINSAIEPLSRAIHDESRSRNAVPESAGAYDADALVMLARLYWVNRKRAKNRKLRPTT